MQLVAPAHDSEHEPVHVTAHDDPGAQLTLPLGPSVTSQSAPAAQLMLHELPHVPLHVASIGQLRVQLLPLHAESPMSHALPASQVHEVPVHDGGGVSLPHATNIDSMTRVPSMNGRMKAMPRR